MSKLSQKGIAHILLLILLLLGLVASVYAVQHARTVLDPKASESVSPIQIVDKDGNPIEETTTVDVFLKISLPDGWVLPPEKTSNLVKQAYAQNDCSSEAPYNGISCKANPPTTEDNCGADYNWCDGGCCRFTRSTSTPSSTLTVLNIFPVDLRSRDLNQRLYVASNFKRYFNELIPWKLDQRIKNEPQEIRMILEGTDRSSSSTKVSYSDSVTLKLIKVSNPEQSEPKPILHTVKSPYIPKDMINYNITLVVSNSFKDPHQVASDITSKINTFVNPALEEAKIARRVSVDKIDFVEDLDNCNITINKVVPDDRITIYLPNEQLTNNVGGWAYTGQNAMCIKGGNGVSGSIILHELGHIFGLPDYSNQDVRMADNKVAPNVIILSRLRDFMSYFGLFKIDPISAEIVNRTGHKRIDNTFEYWKIFTPGITSLKITNDGKPLSNVKIDIFPSVLVKSEGLLRFAIPDNISSSYTTNAVGEIVLGSVSDIFHHRTQPGLYPDYINGNTALFRITYNGVEHFAALTVSDLVIRFFENDETASTQFVFDFDSLPSKQSGRVYLREIGGEGTEISEREQDQHFSDHLLRNLNVN